MPTSWWKRPRIEGVSVKGKKGKGKFDAMDLIIRDKAMRKIFNERWTPELLALFTTDMGGEFQLKGSELSLLLEGGWARCDTCKSAHRPVPGISHCLDCGSDAVRTARSPR
jgi:hypothetical protein